MRIGLFTDSYTPDINGVVTSIVTLRNALLRQGHTVYVITNQPSITKSSFEDGVLRLPGLELKFLYGYVLSTPIHVKALEVIAEMDLDILHAHSEFGIGIFARIVSWRLHIPLVMTYHTTYEDYTHYINRFGSKSIETLSRKAVARLSRLYSKSSQIIITPSQKTKKMLLGYDIKKEITVIPTGLDLSRFRSPNEGVIADIKQKYNQEGKNILVFIGRIAKEKNIEFVLSCFEKLTQASDDYVLLIVGDGPYKDELNQLVSDRNMKKNVFFTGSVPHDQVPSYYHAGDAFVSASLTETQGLTYIEALACGKCVFACPDKPLEGIVVEDKTGFLFNSEDEFVRKVEAYFSLDLGEKQAIEANAFAMSKQFDDQEFALKVLAVYQKAIDVYYGKYVVEQIERDTDPFIVQVRSGDHTEKYGFAGFIVARKELHVGMNISRNELSQLQDDQVIYTSYQFALSKIAARDYTSFEMEALLVEKFGLGSEKLEIILNLLNHYKYIDDERYFRDKIDYHRSQLRGNLWIIRDLSKRGFSADTIETALLLEEKNSYRDRAVERAQHFLDSVAAGSRTQLHYKTRQHLQRQGFESDVIKDALAEVTIHDDEHEKENLKKLLLKNYGRYTKRYSEQEARSKSIKNALSKGYEYGNVLEVVKEIETDEN